MADKIISNLPKTEVVTEDDLLLVVDTPASAPTNKKITVGNFLKNSNGPRAIRHALILFVFASHVTQKQWRQKYHLDEEYPTYRILYQPFYLQSSTNYNHYL